MSNDAINKLLCYANWRLSRGQENWVQTVLMPGIEAVYTARAWVPLLPVVELLMLDAHQPLIMQNTNNRTWGSPNWRQCLLQLYDQVKIARHSNFLSNYFEERMGIRLIHAIIRYLRIQNGMTADIKQKSCDEYIDSYIKYLEAKGKKNVLSFHIDNNCLAIERLLEAKLSEPDSLFKVLGQGVCVLLPSCCTQDYADPNMSKLLENHSCRSLAAPMISATNSGGGQPRPIIARQDIHHEWKRGKLNERLQAIHCLEWIYKEQAPNMFIYRAINGQIVQSFGRHLEPSNRCAYVLIDIDLVESEQMHRFPSVEHEPPLIALSRAFLCHILHRFSNFAEKQDFVAFYRLRRWQPWPGHTLPCMRMISTDEAQAFMPSPLAARNWLAIHYPECVFPRISEQGISNCDSLLISQVDHTAHIVIGDILSSQLRYLPLSWRVPTRSFNGFRLKINSSEDFQYGFGRSRDFYNAPLSQRMPYQSLSQLAAFAVDDLLEVLQTSLNQDDAFGTEDNML